MGGKSSKPPAAPDYGKVAEIQGEKNLEAIRTGATLNRVNQQNPFGSTTYQNLGGDQWSQTTSLTPDQQAILDAQERNQIDLGRVAGGRLSDVGAQRDLDLSRLPSRVNSVQTTNLADLGKLPTDFSGERRRAEDAIYGSATRYLDPQFQQEEAATRTRLINSGNVEGSEGWKNAMADLARRKEAAYSGAREQAIVGGGAESSRMLSDALRGRGQTISERDMQYQQQLTNAGLTNEGRTAALNEMLTERSVPLQEFLQLYSGQPTPGGGSPAIPQVNSPQPADVQGAANSQYGAQADLYNWQQGRNQQNASNLVNLAALAAMYGG